jgi:hypothetical protein
LKVSAADFVHRWFRKAFETEDCFDRFFSAWIALVIRARSHLDEKQLSQPDTDRKAIIQYLEDRAQPLAKILNNLPDQVRWLSARRGTHTDQPILDVLPRSCPDRHARHLRATFDTLARVWCLQTRRTPRWIAGATAEMINHVRNNMFHGQKGSPDDAADRELLDRINCILMEILSI